MKKFQIAEKRASKPPSKKSEPRKKNFGARKNNFGAGNFFFGARIFSSRRQDFGAGLPQKAKIPHKTLHKGAFLCKNCLFFSLFCLANSKAASRKSAQIRQKETSSVFEVTFCQTRVSSDTAPSAAATDFVIQRNRGDLESPSYTAIPTEFRLRQKLLVVVSKFGLEELFNIPVVLARKIGAVLY